MMTVDEMNERITGTLPDLLGVRVTEVGNGHLTSRLEVHPGLMAPNGYLHAATAIGLADTSCGFGALANLSADANGFTTVELKSNFLGTSRGGTIECKATLSHAGRATQVWDAMVTNVEHGKTIVLFRCTQLMLYPHASTIDKAP